MGTERQDRREALEPGGSDELFERLFKLASPRPRPPDADEKYLREVLHAEWDEVIGRRITRRRMAWMAAAASVLIVIASLTLTFRSGVQTTPPVVVASVERVLSEVLIGNDRDEEQWVLSMPGMEVYKGQTLSVPPGGGLAIRMSSGGGLRFHEKTDVALVGGNEVRLLTGTVYFDSRTETGDRAEIRVQTPFGAIRNVGTQFAAGLTRQSLSVSVREGRIYVEQGADLIPATVGEKVTVRNTGDVYRGETKVYGDEWRWAEGLVPTFQLEGHTCMDFLSWVARETGRRLEFDSPEARQVATDTLMRGFVEVEPLLSLERVLETTVLGHRVQGETIHIMLKPEVGEHEDRSAAIITAGEAANQP